MKFLLHKAILSAFSMLLFLNADAQVTGRWKYVDEQDGQPKSIIEVYEYNNRYYGKIVELMPTSKRTHCEKCFGDLKGKPLIGMNILYDLKITTNGGKDGKILDPGTGKIYNCSIELADKNKLKVRGYLGVPTVGKSQYWSRVW